MIVRTVHAITFFSSKGLLNVLVNLLGADILWLRDLKFVSETRELIHICSQPGRRLQVRTTGLQEMSYS